MTASQFITFPCAPANEDYWGGWLSGITDGEGSFILAWESGKDRGTAMFRIALRSDDSETLAKIKTLLGCGWTTDSSPNKSTPNAKPTSLFCVSRAYDQLHVVVPWFERFPLQAKKQRDFLIWKEGVKIAYDVASRRRVCLGGRLGFASKWGPRDKEEFRRLRDALREQREYDADIVDLPEPLPDSFDLQHMPLFADMDPAVLYPSRSSA